MLPIRSMAFIIRVWTACLAAGLPVIAGPAVPADSAAPAAPPDSAGAGSVATVPLDESLERKLDGILAKEGISVGGTFRSQYLHSSIGGPGALATLRSEESVEYTSVDFDLRARPNTATQGRILFRMHQDWRNFFSDIGNPIDSRWISIDGSVRKMFSYSVGDFRRHYSPLTLYSPDIEVMYEPYLFAQRRQEAFDEVFLGNNDRLLQGVNLDFDAAVDRDGKSILRELHVGALGSRLRNVETSVQNGNKVTAFTERSPAEKFLGAGNVDMGLPFGLTLGGTWMRIFDKLGSYSGPGDPDTAAQRTTIWAARAGIETAPPAAPWSLGLAAEYAASSDDSNYFATPPDTALHRSAIDGSALKAALHGGWKTAGGALGVRAELGYLRNDAGYRNELAQSPSFVGERILNIENDTAKVRTNDVRSRDYSTFDAMYRHVFKFAPSEATNLWVKAPFQKLSYTNAIMTQSEMAAFAARRADPALQLVMPFGPATANREGLRADLTVSAWGERLEVKALYARLDEMEGARADSSRVLPKTRFTQAGGGLRFEAASLLHSAYPITLSGSLVRSQADNDGLAGDSVFTRREMTSDFANVGARVQIWKRFALLAGFQRIVNTLNTGSAEAELTQDNLGGGGEYKVAAGAYLTCTLDRIAVAHAGALSAGDDFHQFQTDLFLSVRF